MIEYIFLGIFSLSSVTLGFIWMSVVGTKLLYAEKLKDLKHYRNETIDIIRERLNILNEHDEEYIKLNNLLIELIKIK
jgi:hypothetical protein